MAKNRNRAYNETQNRSFPLNQVLPRIEARVAVWIVRGERYRDLSLAEVLELRAIQSQAAPQLPYRGIANELPGLIYQPPKQDRYKFRERWPLLKQAAELLERWA